MIGPGAVAPSRAGSAAPRRRRAGETPAGQPARRQRSVIFLLCLLFASCANAPARTRAVAPTPSDTALLDDVERRAFHFFWDLADPNTLLIPDRWPTPSFSSIAAVGFGLTAYGIGAERGYVTREAAAERTRATLKSLLTMKQGPDARGVSG